MLRRIWQFLLTGLFCCLLILWPGGQSIHAAVPDPSSSAPLEPGAGLVLQKGPEVVKVGVYITRLDNFDLNGKSFDATFWLWMISPEHSHNRLDDIEFVNAEDVKSSNSLSKVTSDGTWYQRTGVATLHHEWNLRKFPFDRQDLHLKLEESDAYIDKVIYVPEDTKFLVDGQMKIKGWRVVSSEIRPSIKTYMTNFGDPGLRSDMPTSFSGFDIMVQIERTNFTAFWKFAAGAIVAAAIALSSYAFHVDKAQTLSPRFALLSGAVFAAIISLRSASTELGITDYNTLVDQIHLVSLVYVMIATYAGVYTWSLYRRHEDGLAIERLGRRMAFVSTLLLIFVVAGLIRRAMLY